MDLFEVIEQRQSIRLYKAAPIEDEKVLAILEAANRAPSAGNLQAYEIFAIHEKSLKKELARAAYDQEFIAQAPVVLVFCTNPARSSWRYQKRGKKLYCVQDATIACTFAMLAATALGLGSVWVGAFDEDNVHSIIGAEIGLMPVAILPIGYADERPARRPRRLLSELLHRI